MNQENMNMVLERFDQTDYEMQRRIVIRFAEKLVKAEDKLALVLALTDTGSDEFKKAFPPRSARDSHFSCDAVAGWRVVEKIREILLDG